MSQQGPTARPPAARPYAPRFLLLASMEQQQQQPQPPPISSSTAAASEINETNEFAALLSTNAHGTEKASSSPNQRRQQQQQQADQHQHARESETRASAGGLRGLIAELRAAYAREMVPGDVPRPFTAAERASMAEYESIDAYEPETMLYKDYLETRSHEPRWFIWCLVIVLGIGTSAVAIGVVCVLHVSQRARWEALALGLRMGSPRTAPSSHGTLLASGQTSIWSLINWRGILYGESASMDPAAAVTAIPTAAPSLWYGYATLLTFSILCAALAGFVALAVPEAVGAGVPEVFAYFNGVDCGAIASSSRVLCARLLLVVFTVGSGVCGAGHYGPLMLSGAMLGAQTLRRRRWVRFPNLNFVDCFRNPRDERITVMIGAAAGLASVLSVSVSGLLVTTEMITTVLPTHFALYVFVACLVACLVVQSYFSYAAFFALRDRSATAAAIATPLGGTTGVASESTDNSSAPNPFELFSSMAVLFRTELPFGEHVRVNLFQFLPAVLLGLLTGWLAAVYIRLCWLAQRLRRHLDAVLGDKRLMQVGLPIAFTALCVTLQYALAVVAFGSGKAKCRNASSNGTGGDACRESVARDGCVSVPTAVLTTRAASSIGYYGLTGLLCSAADNFTDGRIHSPLSSASSPASSTPRVRIHSYASLAFANPDSALQTLLSVRTASLLPAPVLAVFLLVQLLLSASSAGAALAFDTILPPLLIGASLGRLCGVGVHWVATAAIDAIRSDRENGDGSSSSTLASSWADTGVFALIGAGGFLSGTSGLTFSVAAILMETTSDFHHLLPLMICISVARKVTELLAHDLHDVYLTTRCVPILRIGSWSRQLTMFDARHVMAPVPDTGSDSEDEERQEQAVAMTGNSCEARQDREAGRREQGDTQGSTGGPRAPSLSRPYQHLPSRHRRWARVVSFPTITTVRALATAMTTTTHNAFPVVGLTDATYKGIVTRRQLELLLWFCSLTDSGTGSSAVGPRIHYSDYRRSNTAAAATPTYEVMHRRLPDYLYHERLRTSPESWWALLPAGFPGANEHEAAATASHRGHHRSSTGHRASTVQPLSVSALDAAVDLSPYLDRSAACALRTTSAARVCELFSTLGLRHLVVVDEANLVVGMITRKDLVVDRLQERVRAVSAWRLAQRHARRRAAQQTAEPTTTVAGDGHYSASDVGCLDEEDLFNAHDREEDVDMQLRWNARAAVALRLAADPATLVDWIVVERLATTAVAWQHCDAAGAIPGEFPPNLIADHPLALLPLHPQPAHVAAALHLRRRRQQQRQHSAIAHRGSLISGGSAVDATQGWGPTGGPHSSSQSGSGR